MAIADARRSLEPAEPEAVAVLMRQLFAQLPMPGKVGLEQFRHEMERYPIDLLEAAVGEVIRTHKWETVPKIAQIVEQVRPELVKRQAWLNKLRSAELKARTTCRRPKPAAAVTGAPRGPMPKNLEQLLAQTMAKLSVDNGMGEGAKEAVRARSIERAQELGGEL